MKKYTGILLIMLMVSFAYGCQEEKRKVVLKREPKQQERSNKSGVLPACDLREQEELYWKAFSDLKNASDSENFSNAMGRILDVREKAISSGLIQ